MARFRRLGTTIRSSENPEIPVGVNIVMPDLGEIPGLTTEAKARLTAALLYGDPEKFAASDDLHREKENRIVKLIEQGDFPKAEAAALAEYQNSKNSGDPTLFFNCCCTAANTNLTTGNFAAAKNFAEIALKLALKYEKSWAIYTAQGFLTKAICFRDGLEAAKKHLTKWFQQQPDKKTCAGLIIDELVKGSKENAQVKQLVEFCMEFAAALESDPKAVLEKKLAVFRSLQDPENSRIIAEQLLQIDPENEDAIGALLLAGVFNESEVSEATKDLALATLSKEPDNPTAKLVMAYYFILNKGQPEEAYRLAEELCQANLYRIRALTIMCNASMEMHNRAQAREIAQKLLIEDPEDVTALNALMQIHLFQEEWQKAINLLDQLISLNPEFPLNYSMLAKAHYALGHEQEALVAAKQYLSTLDDNLQENVSVMATLYNLGDLLLAGAMAEKLLRRVPDHPKAMEVMFYILCEDESKKEETLYYVKKLQESGPDEINLLRVIIAWYNQHDLLEEAEKAARHYFEIAPEDEVALAFLVQISASRMNFQEADNFLNKLISLSPDSDKIASLQDFLQQKKNDSASSPEIPTIFLPVKTRKRNGNGKKSAPKPIDEETRAKTVLASGVHNETLKKWQTLLGPASDCCLCVGKKDKGFDSAYIRKNQILLAEIKSINTSHDNERDEIIKALGQLNLYELAYIRKIPQCEGKQVKRLIVLSQKPNFPDQKESDVCEAMTVAEQEGAYFVLWFEDGELRGSELAMEAYEDYLTH